MYHRVTKEIDLMPYNNISLIKSILCLITKGSKSNAVKMSLPPQNVVIYIYISKKSRDCIINQIDHNFPFFYQMKNHKVSISASSRSFSTQ